MIDETKLIEDIRKCYSDYFNVHYSKGYKPNIENSDTSMPLKDVCRFIYLQPKIGEWISCKDRLPENVEDDSPQYLITVKVGEDEYEIDFGWWSKISKYDNRQKKWIDFFGWIVGNDWDEGQGMEVIAWSPLPQPYNLNKE